MSAKQPSEIESSGFCGIPSFRAATVGEELRQRDHETQEAPGSWLPAPGPRWLVMNRVRLALCKDGLFDNSHISICASNDTRQRRVDERALQGTQNDGM